MTNKTGFMGTIVLALAFASSVGSSDEATTLKEIMQGLRDDTANIADGLLTDDFEKVARAARAIAEHPQIPAAQVQLVAAELGPEMPTFKQLDTLVHDLSLEINTAAKALDREAAIAGYQRMMDGCFACHRGYKERVAAVLNQDPGL
jgi:hypothetical protein